MLPIDGALPLPHTEAREARRIGRSVAASTGRYCFYNRAKHELFFALRPNEPNFGMPVTVPMRTLGGEPIRHEAGEIDDVVYVINLGKADASEKNKEVAKKEREEEREKSEHNDRWVVEREKDAQAYAAFLDRRRRGVQRVFSHTL